MSSTTIGKHALRRTVATAILGFGGASVAAPAHVASRGDRRLPRQRRRSARALPARHRA